MFEVVHYYVFFKSINNNKLKLNSKIAERILLVLQIVVIDCKYKIMSKVVPCPGRCNGGKIDNHWGKDEICHACAGTRRDLTDPAFPCRTCNGRGYVLRSSPGYDCPVCNGKGYIIQDPPCPLLQRLPPPGMPKF